MADDARQPLPDLMTRGTEPPAEETQVFALLRRLERDGRRFGHCGRPESEPARLGQAIRLGFATRDVEAVMPPTDKRPARVSLVAVGLMGPEGPLPLHMTRRVLDRLSQRWYAGGMTGATADTTFADFSDMLQHRALALYYRAWADNRPEVQAEREGGGRLGALTAALAGIGLFDTERQLDRVRRRHAPALGRQVDAAGTVAAVLGDVLGAPVTLREFVGDWLVQPRALQTRLGGKHATLGRGAALGPRSFQRQSRIEIRVGPLQRLAFERLLPGTPGLATLRAVTRGLIGDSLDADIRLVLARGEAPPARIGRTCLGRTGWLTPRADADADQLRLPVGARRAA
jgi:type VI secretion system protein ImpH